MLEYYETFQRYNVPEGLKNEIFSPDGNTLDTINNFSKINIFIGANNSGKSRLIRELIKTSPVPYYGIENWKKISNIINDIFSMCDAKLKEVKASSEDFIISNSGNGEIINTEELFKSKTKFVQNSPDYKIADTITYLQQYFVTLPSSIDRNASYYSCTKNSTTLSFSNEGRLNFFKKFDEIREFTSPLIDQLKTFEFSSLAQKSAPRIYIPSIRTLRQFGEQANLKEQTKIEYEFKDHITIYNGQDLANEVNELTNSEYTNRQRLNQFQELLSKEFFDSKEVKLTYHKKLNVLLIKIGEEIEKPIHELGDGLQMIIILIFPFFTYDSGLIAIEEPELFIHPGLQKSFIKFLIHHPRTKNFQIFIATHSNHIIDSINQTDIVSLFYIKRKEKKKDNGVEKNPDFIIDNLAFGNENFLNLLGITTTSVYLSNCTIWVEGITDRLYIQKYLSEYLKSPTIDSRYFPCKQYKEGINYSFALTGGDSIIHWDFSDENEYYEHTKEIIVKKFCSKSLVIVDCDFGKNIQRKKLLAELLRDRFIELKSPEIENLLSQEVINKTLLTYQSVKKAVGNNELPVVKRDIFKSKKAGFIIDKIILKKFPSKSFSANRNAKSSLKSGDKFIFCKKATQFISSNNLTEEAIELVKQILEFVISRNQYN